MLGPGWSSVSLGGSSVSLGRAFGVVPGAIRHGILAHEAGAGAGDAGALLLQPSADVLGHRRVGAVLAALAHRGAHLERHRTRVVDVVGKGLLLHGLAQRAHGVAPGGGPEGVIAPVAVQHLLALDALGRLAAQQERLGLVPDLQPHQCVVEQWRQ